MRIDASLATIGLAPLRRAGQSVPPKAPAWALQRLVIEGDSITSGMPSTYNSNFYSYRYDDSRPDLFVEVRAQGSRTIGYTESGAALNDDGNWLLGNVAEDMAYTPDLITYMIGANDLASGRPASRYISALVELRGHYTAARPQCRVAWSPPIAYNPTGTPHPAYATFMAARADLFTAGARDPAVWGQWCDYYLPMGEHPDFGDAALAAPLFGDSVHPSIAGQTLLLASYSAAINSIADAARAGSTTAYNSVWPSSEANLPANMQIVRRFIVAGIAHTGLALGASVSGAGAQIRLNGGAWGNALGNGSGNGHRIYNGDVIDLRVTTSASNNTAVSVDLTIGSETRTITYQTVAAVDPVDYQYIGHYLEPNPFAARTFDMVFAQDGHALITVFSGVAGTTVSVGGTAATHLFRQERASNVALDVFIVPVTAGTRSCTVTYPASKSHHVIAYGLLLNADPVPVAAVGNATANQSSPHSTPAFTTPANGLAVAFYLSEGATMATTPPTTNPPTTFVAHDYVTYQSSNRGMAVGEQSASGPAIFAYAFGTYARAALVFNAVGT